MPLPPLLPRPRVEEDKCPPCPICHPESSKKNISKPNSSKSTTGNSKKKKDFQQNKTKSSQKEKTQRGQKLGSSKRDQSKDYQKGKAQNESKNPKDKANDDQSQKIKSEKFPVIMQIKDAPDIINWIKSIPYSRRLSFIPRDFSDGGT
jgi:hypothetical protein